MSFGRTEADSVFSIEFSVSERVYCPAVLLVVDWRYEIVMRTALFLVLVLVSAGFALGQRANDDEHCPTIGLNGPLTAVRAGETVAFSVGISKEADPKKIRFRWSLSGGELVSGQGTNHITAKILRDTVATVKVSGLDSVCKDTADFKLKVGAKKVSPILFDEFGKVKNKLLRKRIIALLDALKSNPGAKGYVLSYGSSAKVKKREDLIRSMVAGEASRVVLVERGTEPDLRTRVWIVPAGADSSRLN